MSSQFLGSNVVVVAHQFNPSVLSQLWLVRHGVVGEDDFEPNCIFSEAVAQIRTPGFILVVVPEQLQFFPANSDDEVQRLVTEKVGRITELLPYTPFTAVGLNFIWQITPEDEGIEGVGRRLFFKEDVPLFRNFAEPGAYFGGYLSKDIFDCRLKLDVKPILVGEAREPRLQLSFNFHKDISDSADSVAVIGAMIGRWVEAKHEALRIMRTVLPEAQDA